MSNGGASGARRVESPEMSRPHAHATGVAGGVRRRPRTGACGLQASPAAALHLAGRGAAARARSLVRAVRAATLAAALACAPAPGEARAADGAAAAGAGGAASAAAWTAREGALLPGLAHPPLPGPLVLTGTFGEYRSSHLHAGLDFSTGGAVGMEVYASLDGVIERVRASGAGYGRALYLRAADGRLLVYAHLDAFAEPIARYVAAVQDSAGIYEQDLYPEPGRFRVRAGERIGWSGRSGTGSPHLHFEVRRGDVAYNPLRAGIRHRDAWRPSLTGIVLEPLDEASYVARGAAPRAARASGAPETLLVEGRVRVVVNAVDPGERRAAMAPYAVGARFGDAWVEARFDSASWATDMAELDYVYDRGRAAAFARTTVQLWAAPNARLVSVRSNAPPGAAAGAFEVRPGDPPRPLEVWARDLAGHRASRTVWLRGPRPGETGPLPGAGGLGERGDGRFTFAPLPGARLRIAWRGAPEGAREARILGRPATERGGVWTAVVPPEALAGGVPVTASARDARGGEVADTLAGYRADVLPALAVAGGATFQAGVPEGAPFEAAAWVWDAEGREPTAAGGLVALGRAFEVAPAHLPLRGAARVTAAAASGALPATAGLCRDGGDGWEWLERARGAGAPSVTADTRRLGRFALFADQVAPRAGAPRAPRAAARGAYSTWALTATLTDDGSGVDGRASHFVVDGRRVPSEWDAVRGVLRWRPLAPPAAGVHAVEVVAVDRAGNTARSAGSFVLD